MGIFSKLFNKKSSTTSHVQAVSENLHKFGQREIALCVQLRPGEEEAKVRATLEAFLNVVRSLAEQGQFVDAGGHTEFGPGGFLDLGSSIAGLVYADHSGAPSGALAAVLLNADELQLAKAAGVSRVLSRLGEATREFPFPYTSVRDRPSVVLPGDEQSLLMRVPRLFNPNLSLTLVDGTLVITSVRGTAHKLHDDLKQLPTDSGLALLTNPSSRANGQLVWKPGQDGPAAITPPGSSGDCLSGGMLIVTPGVDEDSVRVYEDGFALLATADTWASLQSAFANEQDFELAASGEGLALRLEHIDANTYLPAGGVRGPEEIVLHTPEAELAAAVEVGELSHYMQELMQLLSSVEDYEIRVELLPDSKPNIDGRSQFSALVHEGLDTLEPPKTSGPVAFTIRKQV